MKVTFLNSGLALALLFVLSASVGCTAEDSSADHTEETPAVTVNISDNQPWSERMALSIMKRCPEAWMNDFQEEPQWNYTLGLILNSVYRVGKMHQQDAMVDYAKSYGDVHITIDP